MKQGVNLPNFGPFGSAKAVADISIADGRAGWDGVFAWDHVVRRDADLDVVDPWVALTAAAVATQRVQLGPLVTPLARRRPWNVARATRGELHGFDVVTVSTGDDADNWEAAGATWWLRELPWRRSYAECLAVVNDGPRR